MGLNRVLVVLDNVVVTTNSYVFYIMYCYSIVEYYYSSGSYCRLLCLVKSYLDY